MPVTVLFDPANQRLTIDQQHVKLSPKAFSVLTYLHQHKDQLVNKEELLSAVWPNVFVTDAVLKVAVGELRKALDDHPKTPRFIETVHRRGYRFIGDIKLANDSQAAPSGLLHDGPKLFGREAQILQLDQCWQAAHRGQRQMVFVNGEAGMGKTALINHWLSQQLANPSDSLLTSVSCFNQQGSSEPYLPILNALSNLLKSPQQSRVAPLLRQYAPSWLLQIPSLLEPEELESLKQALFGVTQQRMLREFADFIEALSQTTPLLLCIEDLHWSDAASLDLLMALAQRPSLGHFMLLGSLRSSELRQENTALRRLYSQLCLQQLCQTVELPALNTEAVSAYLQQCLPETLAAQTYSKLFYRYTEGNPLMLNAAVEHLKHCPEMAGSSAADCDAQPVSPEQIEAAISGGLKHLLSLKVANLEQEERVLLEAAGVSNAPFATECLAAVLQQDVLDIEDTCEGQLLHAQWLAPEGTESWPDGSISESYRFWHQLYRQFFYDSLSAARRRHYHLRFAERLLSGYQGQLTELAAQLAYHFEAGGNFQRAIEFRLIASQQAAQCFAYAEAIEHITRVIELSQSQADPVIQLDARKKHCSFLLASGKLAESINEYRELITASQQSQAISAEIDATLGLADALFWVDRQACLDTAKHAVNLANTHGDHTLQIHANGKYAHFRSVIQGYQPEFAEPYEAALALSKSLNDPVLQCVHYPRHLYYLIIRAEYQAANELADIAAALAWNTGDAVSYLSCEFFHAWALFYQGRWGEMLTVIERSSSLAQKNDHTPWVLHFQLQKAWLLLHACDYEGARSLCQPIYEQARQRPPNSLFFFSLIMLILLETHSPQSATGETYVEAIELTLNDSPLAIDWVLKFPLYQALAEYYLQRSEWHKAQQAAKELAAQAACSGEQSYLAIADYLLARSTAGAQQTALSEKYLAQARQHLEKAELPVIAWRIDALQENWQASKQAINRLLDNLASAPELQTCFRAAKRVQAVLNQAANKEA